ncbi:MAG: hypothetical protein KDJ73_06375 [Notoacmeibacter sp.]|nr:hypothetical protein [Notoacmeibacter sp.]MCC0031909.1 hypothetical protein [Brucellaceae bacterium]
MTRIHTLAGWAIAAASALFLLAAPVGAQEDESMQPVKQIALDDARVQRFADSFPQVAALFPELDKEYEPGDADTVMEEVDYLAGNSEAVKAIEAKVKEAGFDGFEDWYDTAQSVMIARMWLTNPPSAEELDASEAEIQKMEGISDQERQDLLASLAEARDQMETMKPSDGNMAAVKPHLDKLDGVLGGTN